LKALEDEVTFHLKRSGISDLELVPFKPLSEQQLDEWRPFSI